jgi:hypothetical protein
MIQACWLLSTAMQPSYIMIQAPRNQYSIHTKDFPTKNYVKYLAMIIKPKQFSQYLKAGSECVHTKYIGDQKLTGCSQNCGQSTNCNNKKRNKPTANYVP